jgi:RNA ligase
VKIESVGDIRDLLVSGLDDWKSLGEVSITRHGDLSIFNYTAKAQYEGTWNFFETVSRGLIINSKTGEIVARPFDKFWNWLERGKRSSSHIVTVTEKVDGSLGILYRTNNGYKIATRGSFESEQAKWAADFLGDNFSMPDLPDELTLLFEIVYPENRVILDYGGREDLVLLAARNRLTGDYLPFFPSVYELADRYGFSLPRVFTFNDITGIIEKTGMMGLEEGEGFVVEFSDGQRFKFKADRYLELHKAISGLSLKTAARAVLGNRVDEYHDIIPEEFLKEFDEWVCRVKSKVGEVAELVSGAFSQAPRDTRKDFAIWVNKNHRELAPYLFYMLDGKDISPLIFKQEFDVQ